ncbi:MAG TPA: hypothetical protein VHC43_10205 [Mycobacteriales bacterium]|nr:hypothetical protein [Mycobacteriales bacterium]
MELETPQALLARLKLGREEYCQRLLTMLILDAPYPRWNTRSAPSALGAQFLADLDALSFGDHQRGRGTPVFVDEFELPARHADELAGWPDYAVLWEDRLWIIELKTEVGSHRAGQIEHYLDLAAHHHPACHVDLTYLTPPMRHSATTGAVAAHVSHLTWAEVLPLIASRWGAGTTWQRSAVDALSDVLDGLGKSWTHAKPEHVALNEAVASGLELARETAHDGQQRAVDVRASEPEQLDRWRRRLDKTLREMPGQDPMRHVRPWLWDSQTSGGAALTPAGLETGYELRLSKYQEAL